MEIPINIKESWEQGLEHKRKRYRANSNHASKLWHECIRSLVYMRLVDPPDFSIEAVKRIEEGKLQEKYVRNYLRDLGEEQGFEVVQDQVPVEIPELNIRGRLDGLFVKDRKKYAYEIKTTTANKFRTLHTIEDFYKPKNRWQKGYLGQLNIYLLSKAEQELGCVVLKNREAFEPGEFWYELDYDWADEMLEKAKEINSYVDAIMKKGGISKDSKLPERIDDYSICETCDYQLHCLPDINFGEEMKIIVNDEFEAKLDRRVELKKLAKEYDDLKKETNKYIKSKNITKATCGNHVIQVYDRERKGYTVEPSVYKDVRISTLNMGDNNDK